MATSRQPWQTEEERQAHVRDCMAELEVISKHFEDHAVLLNEIQKRYNAYSVEDREQKPELWALKQLWFDGDSNRKTIGIALYGAQVMAAEATGGDIRQYPPHLRRRHQPV